MTTTPDLQPAVVEKQFTVARLKFSARCWGADSASGSRILALHGWLDNANSFQPLAEYLTGRYLPDSCLLALDLAGHGRSDQRSADSGYNLWQDVGEALQVADRMGWQRFSLLGHSRGAMIATLLAAVAPERVERLVLIDGLVPFPVAAADAPEQLASAIRDRQKYYQRRRRRYPSLEEAAEVRTQTGSLQMASHSAGILAERGVAKDSDGYYWVADPRLQGASDVKFTSEQLRAFLRNISAPVVLFLADNGLKHKEQAFASYWQELSDCQKIVLQGGHHFHMEGAEQQIAEKLSAVFAPSGSNR